MNADNDDTAYHRGDNDVEDIANEDNKGRMTRITTWRKIKKGTVMRFDTWIDDARQKRQQACKKRNWVEERHAVGTG